MPTQYQLEQAAGITTPALGKHITSRTTAAARSAYDLLALQGSAYDPAGFAMLQSAVEDCKRELETTV